MSMMFRLLAPVSLAFLVIGCDSSSSTGDVPESPKDVAQNPEADSGSAGLKLPEVVSFNEHVQPILSEYCYHCHGPDEGTRAPEEAPLRLDIEEDAFIVRDDGKPVIIKGDPAASLLVKRMRNGFVYV